MKNTTIITVASMLLSIGIALCAYIHFETTHIAQSKKEKIIAIDELKMAHAALADAVNRRQLGDVKHYDEIKQASSHLRSRNRHFKATLFPTDFVDSNINSLIDEYQLQSEGKLEGVEQYKQAHSIVENSQTIMKRLNNQLLIYALQTNRLALATTLTDTDLKVAGYVQSKGLAYREDITSLMPVIDQYASGLDAVMRQVVAEYQGQINEMMDKFNTNTKAVALVNRFTEWNILDDLSLNYINYIDEQDQQLKNMRTIAIGAILLILIGLIALATNLYKRNKAHREALNDISSANEKYITRSNQYFATEPLLAFGETVSATVNDLADPLTQTTQYINRLAASADSCQPIFDALDQIKKEASLPTVHRDKAKINRIFNDMMQLYTNNVSKEVLSREVINKAKATAANSRAYIIRLLNFAGMAASDRTDLSLTQIINDNVAKLSVIDTITFERLMVTLPKLKLNHIAINKTVKEILDLGVDHIKHSGVIIVKTHMSHKNVQADFIFQPPQTQDIDSMSATENTALLASTDKIIAAVNAQGGDLTTDFFDDQLTISLSFALPTTDIPS